MEYPARLNRYLSVCGLGSRRGCEHFVTEGAVMINGRVCLNLGTQVNEGDTVTVNGRPVRPKQDIVIALHKPVGYVCTRDDEKERRTIYDLLPEKFSALHHVGRLDMDSSGLLLLTNRGSLSHELTHPRHGVEKEYEVTVEEPFEEAKLPKLVHGMMTQEGFAKAERAWLIGGYKIGIVLKQGLKRQIRHMLYQLGHEVRQLVRVRIGGVYLKGLPKGGWRELSEREVSDLLDAEKRAPRREGKPASARSPRPAPREDREDRPRRTRTPGSRSKPGSGPRKRDVW